MSHFSDEMAFFMACLYQVLHSYDHEGNLTSVNSDKNISWNVNGKIDTVFVSFTVDDNNTFDNNPDLFGTYNLTIINFYDAAGNRIFNSVKSQSLYNKLADEYPDPINNPTWLKAMKHFGLYAKLYFYDANNLMLASFTDYNNTTDFIKFTHDAWYLYGSGGDGRVAVVEPYNLGEFPAVRPNTFPDEGNEISGLGDPDSKVYHSIRQIGHKQYELTDHLGNVRLTFADYKYRDSYSLPRIKVLSRNDYYPFGMLVPDNYYQDGSTLARFGFNGMERDDEIAGVGNSYHAMFWMYDSRTARRWNQDPRPNSSISSYGTFALNPVMFTDVLGDTIVGGTPEMAQLDELEEGASNRLPFVQAEYEMLKMIENDLSGVAKTMNNLMLEYKETELNELQSSLIELDRLKTSEQVYVLNHDKDENGANTTYDYSMTIDGVTYFAPIIVNFNPIRFDNGFHNDLAHEMKHCYQFDNLEKAYGTSMPNLDGYSLADELEAYTRGFFFGDTRHMDGSLVTCPGEIDIDFVLARGYEILRNTNPNQSFLTQRGLFFMKSINQIAWDLVKEWDDFNTFVAPNLFKGWRNHVSK